MKKDEKRVGSRRSMQKYSRTVCHRLVIAEARRRVGKPIAHPICKGEKGSWGNPEREESRCADKLGGIKSSI